MRVGVWAAGEPADVRTISASSVVHPGRRRDVFCGGPHIHPLGRRGGVSGEDGAPALVRAAETPSADVIARPLGTPHDASPGVSDGPGGWRARFRDSAQVGGVVQAFRR